MSRDEKTVEMTATWLRAKDGSRGVIWWTGENETIHDAGLLLAGGPLETVRGLRERCTRLEKALRPLVALENEAVGGILLRHVVSWKPLFAEARAVLEGSE